MFTGIIEELGKVRHITGNKIDITCKTVLSDIKTGDSIAVNGVCLTVCKFDKDSFTADVSPETFKVTALENLKSGDFVNLERAMPVNGRFGGHIVSGHTDSVGKIKSVTSNGTFYNFELTFDSEYKKYIVKKGSITINGISLTVAEIDGNVVKIAVIPHTYKNTNLKCLKAGDYVNIEFDMLAKYIEKFLSTGDNKTEITVGFLAENGYL